METTELIKKVRQIEIKSRGLSANIFAGSYKTAFKGHGMSFAEVREYQYGDDVRDIDWNVTARQNKPHIKIFEEERELTIMLMIDVSGSREFGTATQTKQEQITQIAATLAMSGIQNNDKIGVIFFSDRIEKYIPPQKGKKHVLAIISEMLKFEPVQRGTDINRAIQYVSNAQKKRCTTIIISDFFDANSFKQSLQIASSKHDVIAIQVYDPRETELPDVGFMKVRLVLARCHVPVNVTHVVAILVLAHLGKRHAMALERRLVGTCKDIGAQATRLDLDLSNLLD